MTSPRVFLPAILSGVLLWCAYFPLDLGLISCVALAPFLTLVRAEGVSRRRRYLAGFVGGCVFFGLAINWVRVAHPMMMMFTWPVGTMYCAAYWVIALALLRAIDRWELPFWVTLPIVWVSLEYVRAHFPTGFAFLKPLGIYQLIGFHWYSLGYAMHRVSPLIQAADLGGVYLISLAVATINGTAHGWMMRSNLVRRLFRWPTISKQPHFIFQAYETAWASILPILLISYGMVVLSHPAFSPGPRIAAVQGNVPQDEKMLRGETNEPPPLLKQYMPLSRRAGAPEGSTPTPDLVIWPETCFPAEWQSATSEASEMLQIRIRDYQQQFREYGLVPLPRTALLLGLNRYEYQGGDDSQRFNSAVLFDQNKNYVDSYDKMHLVPFGEYVPLSSKFLQNFTPYKHDYSCTPGTRFTRFPLGAKGREYTFGMLICYEDSDPYLARQYNPASGRMGGVDFLVNISNDAWFYRTEEHEQHLAICRFRAIEARRSVVRAVNTGISAIIDADGKLVVMPTDEGWSAGKAREAIIRGDVPIDTRESIYAAYGDWVPTVTWTVLLLLILISPRIKSLIRFQETS
jgi:apolipoprotein N-acyltransferase